MGRLALIFVCLGLSCSRNSSHEPVTLTFLDIEWEASDQLSGQEKDLHEFTRQTGIQVKRLPAPESSLSQLELWKQLLGKGSAAPDVVGIDVIWSGMLNQYLIDLKRYISADLFTQNPVVVASYSVGDKLIAIPHHAYIGVLLYRADLLREYGFRKPPTTWDELERMAARIQAGERAKGEKDFWGFVWQGAPGEDLTCAGLEWQMSEGAGRIIEEDQTISVNNPQTVRAWQRAARWVGSISPPGVTAYGKWDANNLWFSDKAAFLRAWVSDYSIIDVRMPPSKARDFEGMTSLPSGGAGRFGTLGGNGLAVPRSSAHPREAAELIRFLRRRDLQLMQASEQVERPKGREQYQLPTILKLFPQRSELREHGGSAVARPSVVTGEKYQDVTQAYIRELHSVLTGERTPAAAVAALEKELVENTGFRTGAPPSGNLRNGANVPATRVSQKHAH